MKIYIIIIVAVAVITSTTYLLSFSSSNDYNSSDIINLQNSVPLGDADAPLTMLEWGDYQCTHCYRFHQTTLDILKGEYVNTGALRIIFYDFPLNGQDSVLAAQASHCAADQQLYWEYHDILYENWAGEKTGWITPLSLYGFALDAGLDISKYNDCVASGQHLEYVQKSYTESQNIGIDATPSFIITNGTHHVKIVGNQPYEAFVSTIQDVFG
ncbi:MAG: DsbA family protein [Cenarchaeum sp. SB0661_bin_35]|nr:DsbA family protein [Cenarchaeum sp. SB0662_bin_33]MYC79212.1 DsbA family protein [Cenarchaeum sp. SB0661_bin_35]MYG32828.1 DsbA family protein [Cenarchaeum sp. SB0677_bin_16]